MSEDLLVCHLGRVEYRAGLDLQLRLRARVQAGELPGVLLLLEHDPVYARGRRTAAGELPMGADWYRAQGIDVVDTPRGGKATYHGPGQLVGYPIIRVSEVPAYVCRLEQVMIRALAEEGVEAECREGLTGVWVGERKIGSIGVHLSHGVSTHGFSVNVEGDLQPWSWIVPCGLEHARMTSVAVETGHDEGPPGARLATFRGRIARIFCEVFDRQPVETSPAELERATATV